MSTKLGELQDALAKLQNNKFDICFIDLNLDESEDMLGLKLIPIAVNSGTYTVVMTSIEDEEVTEQAYKQGCQDLYNKGNEQAHIAGTINRYLLSKDSFVEDFLFRDLFQTKNLKYKNDLKKLLKMIPTDIPVCILGETGTGKSYLAKAIHDISKKSGEYVEINCATYSGDTLKSELFGHVRGSFTGATQDNKGKLLLANNGTLFLDEIGSMSLEMQEQLLKACEEQSFYPVGSNKLVKSNFRIWSSPKKVDTFLSSGLVNLFILHRT